MEGGGVRGRGCGGGEHVRAATISRFQLILEGRAEKIPVGTFGDLLKSVSTPRLALGTWASLYNLEGKALEKGLPQDTLSAWVRSLAPI